MQFSNKFYDVMKWVCLIAIPALDTFLGMMLPTIGVAPDVTTKVVAIIAGLGTLIGTLIGVSTASYNKTTE